MEILRRQNKGNKGLFNRDYNFIKNALYLGYGVNLVNQLEGKKPRIVDIYKAPDMRSTHLICLGRTRWGKTRFIERAIVDDIESGMSIFHIDPKMDYEGLEAILDAVIRTERYDDFMFFSPYYTDVSVSINVFYNQIPDAISDIVKAMSPAGKEDFFKEIGGELAKAVSIAKYLKGEGEIRFVDLFQYTSVEEINDLYNQILSEKDEGYVEVGGIRLSRAALKVDALLSLKKIKEKDKSYWSKVNTTIELVLSQISTGQSGKVFGKAIGNPLFDRMTTGKPFIFTAVLGSLFMGKDTAGKIARMINAMHEKAYGWLYMKFAKLYPPVSEYWDEGSISIYDGAIEKINKVGGVGGYIQIFTQSFADFKMNAGEEGAKVFFDNADVMLLSVLDEETASYFSKMAGTVIKAKPMWTREEIIGTPEKMPLIPPEYFMRMPKGAFHSFIEGRWYRGYSPMLKDRRSIIIEPLPYPDSRIVEHFAKKYNVSVLEASDIVKNKEVYFDYDWIMKEKLADLWIDLRDLPYYKNYVANRKEDTESYTLLDTMKPKDYYEMQEGDEDKLKDIINIKKGELTLAFCEDSYVYVHFYTFKERFQEPKRDWLKPFGKYQYVKIKPNKEMAECLKNT